MRVALGILIAVVVVAILSALPLRAVDPTKPTLSDRDAAHRLLSTMKGLELSNQIIDRLFDDYRENLPDVPEKVWMNLRAKFDTSELGPVMEEIYMRYFTSAELNGIADFFESPLGQLYIESQPSMLEESMTAGRLWAEGINERLLAELREKELITPL